MAKTGFFRVAVEGATTDGRTISRDWIDQMAAGYNPDTYTARINCEHIKGFSPDAPFNAYGSVLALKAEDITLTLNGKPEQRRALFAQLDANDNLVSTVRAGQKIFTSIEVSTNFARTGRAGLVGLAITDNPASLGCEALSFSALKPVFDARKQEPDNLFTAATEADIHLAGEATADKTGAIPAIEKLTGALHQFAEVFRTKTEPEPASETAPNPAEAQLGALTAAIDQFTSVLGETAEKTKAQEAGLSALRKDFTALTEKLSATEAPRGVRSPATGGAAEDILTNC